MGENSKLNYSTTIKQHSLDLFEKKTTERDSISEAEGQSFTNIFAVDCKKKNLICAKCFVLWQISHWGLPTKIKRAATTKNICFETIYKIYLLFLKHARYQTIYPLQCFWNAYCKNDFVAGLKLHLFKSWGDEIMNYLSLMLVIIRTWFLAITAMSKLFCPNREVR